MYLVYVMYVITYVIMYVIVYVIMSVMDLRTEKGMAAHFAKLLDDKISILYRTIVYYSTV